MAWRKWLVRGIVLALVGGLALLGVLYQRLTNPEAIRRQVLDRLQADFPAAQVSVEHAEFRPLGGIEVHEIRLARRDDLDRADFAYVPSAVLYHDKEQVLTGRVALRKVELNQPRLRLVRNHDGRWNVAGLAASGQCDGPVPTLVVHQGRLIIEDRQAAPGTPPLEIQNVNLTVVNDPRDVLTVAGSGTCDLIGPVQIKGTVRRGEPASLQLTIEAPNIPIGPALVQQIAGFAPEAAEHLRQLRGKGALTAAVRYDAGEQQPLHYDVKFALRQATFSHDKIPWDLDRIEAAFHCADGQLLQADLKGHAGPAFLRAQLKDLKVGPDLGASLADAVRELEVQAEQVPINEELFARLPPSLRSLQKDYQPRGTAAVGLTFRRQPSGQWRRCWTIKPQKMHILYALFPYPIDDVEGAITFETVSEPPTPSTLMTAMQGGALAGGEASEVPEAGKRAAEQDRTDIDLRGRAAGTTVFMKGSVEGHDEAPGLNFDIWADNVPIDDALHAALPESYRALARSFHLAGKIDIKTFLRRPAGAREFTNRYLIQFHDANVCYDPCPYPLEHVSCTLDLKPDRWEFRNFVGTHKGGTLRASGGSQPLRSTRVSIPGAAAPPPTQRVSVSVKGENILLDEDFEKALSPGRETLANAWRTFALAGRMNFQADIEDLPNKPQDIDVTVSIGGCRMKPSFFPYALEDVAATLRCSRQGVQVVNFKGRHGQSRLAVDKVTVILKPAGGYWAKLDSLNGTPLIPDDELLQALPVPLRKGLLSLNLKDPFTLKTLLVIDQSHEPGTQPVVFWDGSLRLRDATLSAGVPVTGVTGVVSLQGRHNGQQVEDVAGNLMLDRATVFNQPLQKVHSRIQVWKDSPDILRFKDLKATLFGGQVGGEARVEFGSIFRYELDLTALQIRLEEFGKHNFGASADLKGILQGGLHLTGEGTEQAGLKGNGNVEVRDGKMYRLPLLLDLLKWLNLRMPDRTAFEQANINFGIVGTRVDVTKLELYGNPISVRGAGTMNLDGSNLNLDLNADWGRMGPIMPPALRLVSREVSNQLLRIKVRGGVGNVKFEQELVPIVVDPLKKVFNTMQPGG